MSSFFLPSKGSSARRKRKKPLATKKRSEVKLSTKTRSKAPVLDEEIASDSEEENTAAATKVATAAGFGEEAAEEEEETAPEKRLRLAKEYLARLEEDEREEKELADIDHDAIAHRLRQDVLEQAGKLQRKVAHLCTAPVEDSVRVLKGHQLPVTCVTVSPDDKYIYSGSKDCCIIKWSVGSGVKEVVLTGRRGGLEGVVGHRGHVLALAVSSDSKFLASGGQDCVIHIWDSHTNTHLHTFKGHRAAVSGLVFRRGTHELFSCSFDRTVKIWNVDEMAYVETLFGHQDSVAAIDCLMRERPVTVGMSDRSARIWKVVTESQLVFNGHKASIDCVGLLNEDHFVTGSQDGTLAIWNILKKKPLVSRSHHLEGEDLSSSSTEEKEFWVSAVAALPNSDVVASGSSNGFVRVWKCGENFRSLELCFSVPLRGFINGLCFSPSGESLVAGVAQEHRLGRWWRDKAARNTLAILPLRSI